MSQVTRTIATMLALVTLTGCLYIPPKCKAPVPLRVFFDGLTLGLHELDRALTCPGEDELHDLKIKAREGDPDAQAALGAYYYNRISPWHTDYKRYRRSAANLMRCAADGGSHAAQDSPVILFFLEEPNKYKIVYKYTKISIERRGCDCEDLFQNPPYLSVNRATNECAWNLCPRMREAKDRLNAAQISEVENEIVNYKPSPRPCNVED